MLNSTADIYRATVTKSSATGAAQYSWAAASSGVLCTVQEGGSFQDRTAMRETGKVRATAYFPYGTDVRVGDRVQNITTPAGLTSRVFGVVGPPIDGAGRGVYTAVPVEEVKGGPVP